MPESVPWKVSGPSNDGGLAYYDENICALSNAPLASTFVTFETNLNQISTKHNNQPRRFLGINSPPIQPNHSNFRASLLTLSRILKIAFFQSSIILTHFEVMSTAFLRPQSPPTTPILGPIYSHPKKTSNAVKSSHCNGTNGSSSSSNNNNSAKEIEPLDLSSSSTTTTTHNSTNIHNNDLLGAPPKDNVISIMSNNPNPTIPMSGEEGTWSMISTTSASTITDATLVTAMEDFGDSSGLSLNNSSVLGANEPTTAELSSSQSPKEENDQDDEQEQKQGTIISQPLIPELPKELLKEEDAATVETIQECDLSTSSLYADLPFAQDEPIPPSSSLPVAAISTLITTEAPDEDELEDFPTPLFLQPEPLIISNKSESTSLIPYTPPPIPPTPQVLVPSLESQQLQPSSLLNTLEAETPIPHRGLMNLGNTCYFNSALQMLMSIDGFVNEIIDSYQVDLKNVKDLNVDAEVSSSSSSSGIIPPVIESLTVCDTEEEKKEEEPMVVKVVQGTPKSKYPLRDALAQFFTLVRSLSSSSSPSSPTTGNSYYRLPMAVDPSELKQVIDSLTGQFIGYRQQDAHELVSTLLDLLHDELKDPEEEEEKEKEEAKNVETKEEAMDETKDKQVMENSKVDEPKETDSIEMKQERETDDNSCSTSTTCTVQTENHVVIEGELQQSHQKEEESMDVENESCLSETIHTSSLTVQVNHSEEQIETSTSEQMEDAIAISKPKEEPEGYVLVEKMDVEDNGELVESTNDTNSSSKKARMSSPCSTLGDSYVHCPSIPKRPSYSELNVNDIASLLHGDSGEDSVDMTSTVTTQVTTPPRRSWASVAAAAPGKSVATPSTSIGKLIGGRLPHLPPPITLAHEESTVHISSENDAKNEQVVAMDVDDANDENDTISHPASPLSSNDEPESETEKTSKQIITPVDTYFTTRVRTCLTCDSCHYTRSHEETFRYLSIEVGSGKDDITSSHDRTVTEGIRKFFSPEKRELKCEKCFCESATQTMEIIQLPRALLLHMKRFIVDVSPDYSRISYRKNQAAIDFGKELSLNSDDQCGILGDFLGKDVQFPFSVEKQTITNHEESDCGEEDVAETSYKIRSIVNHIGSSASCGHYTADARKLYGKNDIKERIPIENEKKLEWTRFNDSSVSRINDYEAMQGQAQKTAYMLMYESA